MKLPRSLSGSELVKILRRVGYDVTRQTGSHIRLTHKKPFPHHVTIPNHDPLRIGALSSWMVFYASVNFTFNERSISHVFT